MWKGSTILLEYYDSVRYSEYLEPRNIDTKKAIYTGYSDGLIHCILLVRLLMLEFLCCCRDKASRLLVLNFVQNSYLKNHGK